MKILWIEKTDASEKDISKALGTNVELKTAVKDIKESVKKQQYDVIVMDDLVENAEKIIKVLDREVKQTPILVLSEEKTPFKTSANPIYRVREPFDIPEVQKTIKNLKL